MVHPSSSSGWDPLFGIGSASTGCGNAPKTKEKKKKCD